MLYLSNGAPVERQNEGNSGVFVLAQLKHGRIDELGLVLGLATQPGSVNVLRQITAAFQRLPGVVGSSGGASIGVVIVVIIVSVLGGAGTRMIAGRIGQTLVTPKRLPAMTLGRVLDAGEGKAAPEGKRISRETGE